jgi:hypothetical protein
LGRGVAAKRGSGSFFPSAESAAAAAASLLGTGLLVAAHRGIARMGRVMSCSRMQGLCPGLWLGDEGTKGIRGVVVSGTFGAVPLTVCLEQVD